VAAENRLAVVGGHSPDRLGLLSFPGTLGVLPGSLLRPGIRGRLGALPTGQRGLHGRLGMVLSRLSPVRNCPLLGSDSSDSTPGLSVHAHAQGQAGAGNGGLLWWGDSVGNVLPEGAVFLARVFAALVPECGHGGLRIHLVDEFGGAAGARFRVVMQVFCAGFGMRAGWEVLRALGGKEAGSTQQTQ